MKKSVIIIITIIILALIWGIIFWISSSGGQKGSHYQVQGVKVDVLQQGKEDGAKAGDTMTVNYTISLPDGKKVYSTYENNRTFTFTLGGTGNVKLLPG